MRKIATLGPAGTFCEIAAKKYNNEKDFDGSITFYQSISKAFKAIGEQCKLGIVPIENTLDGYVQPTLELLSKTKLNIIDEVVVPIQFSFVGNSKNINDVKRLYVQFKTQGQCCDFLEQFGDDVKIITTESNAESFISAKYGKFNEAAIVPHHMLKTEFKLPYEIENVTDSKENQTRFIVVSEKFLYYYPDKDYKTSLIIIQAEDKPGSLSSILNEFACRNINLMSILSHPNKETLGKYHFFIDIEGNYFSDKNVKEAIDNISISNKVRILGVYENAMKNSI
ncbi:prephenate dehydratase [Clostridium pasteurianum DSM 525 = ATCC 6013]|uniref:Prephenate dehydratase n=1 Tax=Clostridium pasteurianum DSM 525 = ATCC 6013 TaxID=1262449 RepID=A0A0H3JB86_CLOPA|nr:prephenate dehydratase domain-containing protein [Clostridium pasteurianum]AJA49295.1 prephenate dehydratase [Clostridium pasteurianum DSM 525 = ATCC 6013]AJA53283.1 prephenate dehydratase [Clostridium pasteurianum DSM 525 = ATCC 6013]AOZ76473.1 prephenate dehydratase [Clostridium pasteurianum DSM 525 = ATCC 6013]AOZ80270.1 prephenate dehydratase [Clostridium pasteurianum]ELP58315.1 prephenate dehydratase [Clostridium pasteurianum DSM 525 = ATCC 6013]